MKRFLRMQAIAAAVAGTAAGLWAMVAAAQEAPALPRVPGLQLTLEQMQAIPDSGQVVVKFREGLTVRLSGGRLSGLDSAGRASLGRTLAEIGLDEGRLRRLHSVPEAELDAARAAGRAASGLDLADLNNYYLVDVPPGRSAAEIAEALGKLESVEFAEPVPLPAPPPQDIAPPTPDFSNQQGYGAAAPAGIGIAPVAALGGVRGGDVRIVDIEYSWQMNHEDLNLPPSRIINTGGTAVDPFNSTDHGTAVLGQLVGGNNGYGVTGLVYDAQAFVAAANTTNGYNLAAAILASSTAIRPGDVILIEQQWVVCNLNTTPPAFGPSEWTQAVFDAIQTAVANGRVVVQAAGNGNVNLDQPACLNRFNPAVRDSGAIIVGAGSAGGRERLGFSSYGQRVNVQGWGQSVTTTGYGDLFAPNNDVRQFYTDRFSGTSSASPIVTAAVAAIQGRLKACNLPVLTPAAMRNLLRQTGSAQVGGGGNIGPLPNVEAALVALGIRNDCSAGQPAATTTTISGPTSSIEGQSVTFSVTVRSAAGTPTGSVSFRRNGVQIGGLGTLDGNGEARFTTSTLPLGAATYTVSYLGSPAFLPSDSAPLTHTVVAGGRPDNDDFANRTEVQVGSHTQGTNTRATREAGEPPLRGATSHTTSVWFMVRPNQSGQMTIDTFGSNFDTLLAVYTGGALINLALVGDSDDEDGTLQSRVVFAATAGTAYQIVIAGYNGVSGIWHLNVALTPANRPTTTTLTGPTTGTLGQALTYVAQVADGVTPTAGNVVFRRNGTAFATVPIGADGRAQTTVSNFPEGTHEITARYGGATGFQPSISNTVTTVVSDGAAGVFRGGGSLFNASAACPAWLGGRSLPATVRYWPAELNPGTPSQVSVAWRGGSEHVAITGPFVPGTSYARGIGRAIWGAYLLHGNRPQLRVVARQVTRPAGGTLARAEELVLRMIIRNAGGAAGCTVTAAATVRRAD